MNNNNNVIQFPKENIRFMNPLSKQDNTEILGKVRLELADEISDDVIENTIQILSAFGVLNNLSDEAYKDCHMIEQSIRSLIYRTKGLDHPLQSITEQTFSFEDPEDETEDDEVIMTKPKKKDLTKEDQSVKLE